MREELTELTLKETLEGLEKGSLSSLQLVEAYISRINKFDKKLKSFITVREEAKIEAKKADEARKSGVKKKLLGIPFAVKDNFLTKGIRTTSASYVLDNYIAHYNATSVQRLLDEGAIIIGKTNLDAWGHGSSGEHTDYGIPNNPYSYGFVTGGSSSGSAAAVAARFCLFGTGSDTGGSNRQPGSYCNVVGLKPTYGRVSRYGVIAMASSTDSIGHLTRTIWDSAYVLSITAGRDEYDATSSFTKPDQYHELLEVKEKLTIGLPKEFFEGLNKKLAKIVMTAVKILGKQGHKIIEVSIPTIKYAYPIYAVLQTSEVSSNLAKFDGIRYGNGREKFQDEAKRRIMIGTHSLSSGYADKYYIQAAKGRTLLINDFERAFAKADVLVGPVYPFAPFKHGEREKDPLQMYLSDVLTVPANLTGHPGISVPIEFMDKMPTGFQIIGKHFQEKTIFQVAQIIERELMMYKIKPQLKA